MKLSTKSLPTLIGLGLLGCIVGGLAWELFERILSSAGVTLALDIGPIGFDLHVVSMSFLVNPGTFMGLLGVVILFFIL